MEIHKKVFQENLKLKNTLNLNHKDPLINNVSSYCNPGLLMLTAKKRTEKSKKLKLKKTFFASRVLFNISMFKVNNR